jgi:uncharacterized membrane protein
MHMPQLRYNLQILDGPWGGGDGFGYGVNDFGEVVGVLTMPFDPNVEGNPGGPAIWLPNHPPNVPTVPYFPDWPTGGELLKVDAFGNAVGQVDDGSAAPWSAVVNGTSLIVDLRSLGRVLPSDINNQATVTGTDFSGGDPSGNFGSRAFIYTFLPIPGNTIWLSPLPNSTGIVATGINDLGDVVGGCDNNAAFFYSAPTKNMTGIDSCFLNDINVNRLAVGYSGSGPTEQPIMVDLSKANPVPQSIPVLKGYVGATATAVNSNNTIVGFCNSQNEFDLGAFVYYDGNTTAFDLNTVLGAPTPYFLVDAMDINESGQIVGTATLGPIDQPTGVYAYIATPYELPPPPHGPVRSWPMPIWVWPWGWLPYPGTPPSFFPPTSPMLRLAAQIPRIPITGKRRDLQKMLSAHRSRITRPTPSKNRSRRKNKRRT